MTVSIHRVPPDQVSAVIDDLARLRIAVFAEWPYLYDGDREYEARYLADFASAPDAVLIVARDGSTIVGAATGSPMIAQDEDIRAPVSAHGIDCRDTFYFGESVLLPEYRGQGIGHAFFDQREEHARACGAKRALFAAVIRPEAHPLRPEEARDLSPFWRGRGYRPVEGLTCAIAWKEHSESEESHKPLQFWMREF